MQYENPNRPRRQGRPGRQPRRAPVAAAILVVLAIALGIAAGVVLALKFTDDGVPGTALPGSGGPAASLPAGASAGSAPQTDDTPPEYDLATITPRSYAALALPGEMRAMWLSFLEWKQTDFGSEAAFRAAFGTMADNCVAMGLNTIMAAVRPFGDALYKSSFFPWSHVMNGTQGQDPGFDPLAVMIEEAHGRGLRLEAWLNPYRVKDNVNGPDALSQDNPAAQNPALVRDVGGNLWYDPGLAEVRKLVTDGVVEIVLNYDVDGIHFDDYFYPEFTAAQKEAGDDTAFDAALYEANGGGLALAEWRRQNVNTLVQTVYGAVKAANPAASFGISPQGNNDNNYGIQYSDVKLWMMTPGYVDYVMPQLYWGFGYLTQSGRDQYAFGNITAEWAFYPRADEVKLYAGLAAYRLGKPGDGGQRTGFGDGGANDQAEWESGHNLADMVAHLRGVEGFSGFSLFRYEFLYQEGDALSEAERAALAELLAG